MVADYDVHAEREGQWWVFRIPALGTSGQACSLSEVDAEARGIISAWVPLTLREVPVSVSVTGREDGPGRR